MAFWNTDVLSPGRFISFLTAASVLASCYGSTFMLADHLKSAAAAGQTISSGVIAVLLSAFFSGHLAERIGLVKSLVCGAILLSLAMLGFAFIKSLPGINYVSGVLLGMGWAVYYILAPLIIIQFVSAKERIKYLSYLFGAQMLGLGMATPIGKIFVDNGLSYDRIYLGLSVLALACAAYLIMLVDMDKRKENLVSHRLSLAAVWSILRSRSVVPVVMICLLASIFSNLSTFQSVFAAERQLDPSTFFIVFTTLVVISRFGVASQLGRLSIHTLALWLVIIIFISQVLFLMTANLSTYISATVLFALGYGLSYSTFNAMAVNMAEQLKLSVSVASQVFTLVYFMGIFGSPVIAGRVIDLFSINAVFYIFIAISLITVIIALLLRSFEANSSDGLAPRDGLEPPT